MEAACSILLEEVTTLVLVTLPTTVSSVLLTFWSS